jgi:hypothetical protein
MGEDAFPRQWGFCFALFAILPKMLPSFFQFIVLLKNYVEKAKLFLHTFLSWSSNITHAALKGDIQCNFVRLTAGD